MDHNDSRHMLSEYIDGSVTPEEKAGIERHLETCSQCRDAVTELRKTVEHIKTIEEIEPPAWMTQEIMARVRAEKEKKRGLLQRLFLPLHVKLPLEALGVLFLAITAFFIFQNQPATDHPEGTISEQQFGRRPQASQPAPETAKKERGQAPRPKDVPPQPEYKALDMKQEYKTPLLPVPASKAPAPELQQQQKQPAESGASYSESTQTPRAARKKLAPSPAFSAPEPSAEADHLKASSWGETQSNARLRCLLIVSDGKEAASRVEEAAKQLGGSVIRNEANENTAFMNVSIEADKTQPFLDRLRMIGELQEKHRPPSRDDGKMTIEVTIRQR